MTYSVNQAVEVYFPTGGDLAAHDWGFWTGVVTEAGHIGWQEIYHVRIDAGQTVTVRPENIWAVPEMAGLFAEI